jgi:hypothetical protein
MKQILVALAACAIALGASAPVAAAQEPGPAADLSLTMSVVGTGHPRAKVGQTATFAVVVRNLGPDTADGVTVGMGQGDQFNTVSIACGSGAPHYDSSCTIPQLAPNGVFEVRFVAVVCCFPVGESRNAFVSATASSSTPDPNPDNNAQQVIVHLNGRHGFFPPS